ncbi:tetratricopeptide repeat protein [Psychrobacter celer]|uniref:tetratricopeptide repeat protein n=1 Tax=Psychrobacter celer TaxID=306572 RepID=UPI0018DFFF97|nr:tetratricopeptide repeat protein [Psychrobacter celer]
MYGIPVSRNYIEAQYLIGVDYLLGNKVAQDYTQALEWFQKSASEDYAPAQDVIGCMYSYGFGVDQDYVKAFEWCLKAAEQDYDIAQNNVAYLYKEGFGVLQDNSKAFEWYQKASEQDNADAHYELGNFYSEGIGVEIDKDKANYYYHKAACKGHLEAEQCLQKNNELPQEDKNSNKKVVEEADNHIESIDFESDGSISFKTFFDNYFRDESKMLPQNPGGGVWFYESMDFDESSKFYDKASAVREKNDYMIDTTYADFIIDTSFTRNFGVGLFLHVHQNSYQFHLKNDTKDWEILNDIEEAYYSESDKALYIEDYKINLIGDVARFYGKRLVECINAYLNQNELDKIDEEIVSNSELVTDALDNIDDRLTEINQKLNDLREDSAA